MTKKIYFIGIKGVGMTMLAQYLSGLGMEIVGSDMADTFMTDKVLADIKAEVKLGFSADNVPTDVDLIIYSTAYNESNPEVAKALASKTKTITYAEALSIYFNQSHGIAVCGSHGKTTTTAWLGFVLDRAGLQPSVMVGASVPQFHGASIVGKSNYLVIEADEYQNKLAWFNPKIILLNNIDYDHPDFFPDRASYTKAFADFIKKIPTSGFLVANFDDTIIREITTGLNSKIISYSLGENEANLIASDIKYFNGQQFFKLSLDGEDLGDFSIQLLGRHNLANALAVVACSLELNLDLVTIRTQLSEFTGTARRMEKMGDYHGALIIDDYAHHPTEIKATLSAIEEAYSDKNVITVFHPHTHSRTKALLHEFADSFENTDELIVLEIYASARDDQNDITSHDLIDLIKIQHPNLAVTYAKDLAEAEAILRPKLTDKDLVLLCGAGDVFRVGENLTR